MSMYFLEILRPEKSIPLSPSYSLSLPPLSNQIPDKHTLKNHFLLKTLKYVYQLKVSLSIQ